MDNKQFNSKLSKRISLDYKETSSLIQAVASTMAELMSEGDKIAIPGFGTFSVNKLNEEISVDLTTGKRLLLPPKIVVEFTPSALMVRRLDRDSI